SRNRFNQRRYLPPHRGLTLTRTHTLTHASFVYFAYFVVPLPRSINHQPSTINRPCQSIRGQPQKFQIPNSQLSFLNRRNGPLLIVLIIPLVISSDVS